MKNKQERKAGIWGESVGAASQEAVIATKAALQFLFDLLEKRSPQKFTINGNYTKNSLKVLEDLYNNVVVEEYNKQANIGEPLFSISAETFASLINKGAASNRGYTIHALAGLALYLENNSRELAIYAEKIKKKTSWPYFLEEYRSELNNTESYLWYYWQQEAYVGIAEMEFSLSEDKTHWTGCSLTYYEYDASAAVYKKNTVRSEVTVISPADAAKSPRFFSFYVLHDWQVSQYTIPIPSDIQHRDFFICSYTTYLGTNIPLCGIGILMKYKHVAEQIRQINNNKKIDDAIFNILYERNAMLSYEAPDSNALPNQKEVDNIKLISGVWKAYDLRNSHPDAAFSGEGQGGIELNYLYIEPNGVIHLKCDETKTKAYQGFMRYPLPENDKLIKCNIQVSKTDKVYKMHLLLNVHPSKEIIDGVMAGWSDKNEPFATLIVLKKTEEYEGAKDALMPYAPRFIAREKIAADKELSPALLWFLRNSKHYLDLPENCLPDAVELQPIFKSLAGIFYVLSRDYEEGLIDKAKLEILSTGEFKIDYPDVAYKGTIREFITTSATDRSVYFNITERKLSVQQHWSAFSGCLAFDVGNIFSSDADKLSEKIKTLIGFSLRKNVNNLLQVKKEILIPALDEQAFRKEKSEKYTYAEEDKLTGNLKEQTGALTMEYRELLRGLRGKENNIMLLSGDQTTLEIIRETDYFEIYMNAFLFEVVFAGLLDYPRIYNYLIQALLHADEAARIFTKLEVIFSKYQTGKETKEEIVKETTALFENIISRANKGGLTKLLTLLKSPMVHKRNLPIVNRINNIIQKIRSLK